MIEVRFDQQALEALRAPMELLKELETRPAYAAIHNKYMVPGKLGWWLEYGTGPRAGHGPIVIRPVKKKMLKFPKRDASGKQVVDQKGRPIFYYAYETHPQGIRPHYFVRGTLANASNRVTREVTAYITSNRENASRSGLQAVLTGIANDYALRLRARTGGVSKRVANAFIVRAQ